MDIKQLFMRLIAGAANTLVIHASFGNIKFYNLLKPLEENVSHEILQHVLNK